MEQCTTGLMLKQINEIALYVLRTKKSVKKECVVILNTSLAHSLARSFTDIRETDNADRQTSSQSCDVSETTTDTNQKLPSQKILPRSKEDTLNQ